MPTKLKATSAYTSCEGNEVRYYHVDYPDCTSESIHSAGISSNYLTLFRGSRLTALIFLSLPITVAATPSSWGGDKQSFRYARYRSHS